MIEIGMDAAFVEHAVGNDFNAVVEVVRMADAKGIDYVTAADHVIMNWKEACPYLSPEAAQEYVSERWHEPLLTLAAFASATRRIKLATRVLIAPLRPAVLLAKQLGTLDIISNGRLVVGLGVGWQRAEYEACGMDWDGRFSYMEEQMAVCQTLWTQAPAAFQGRTVSFADTFLSPPPIQSGGPPFWLGVGGTEKGAERIARFAQGWFALSKEPGVIAAGTDLIRAAFVRHGRDPMSLKVYSEIQPLYNSEGGYDIDATLQQAGAMRAAGVNVFSVRPGRDCRSFADVERLMDRMVDFKGEANAKISR